MGEFLEAGRVESGQRPHRRGDPVGRIAFAEAEFPEQELETSAAMQLVDEATQFVALADDLAQQIVEAALAGLIQDLRRRPPPGRCSPPPPPR